MLAGLEQKLEHMLKTKLQYRLQAREDEDTFSRVPQWVSDLALTRFHLGKAPPVVTASRLVSHDETTGKVRPRPLTKRERGAGELPGGGNALPSNHTQLMPFQPVYAACRREPRVRARR